MSTQPISLPQNDYPMAMGSYTGSNNGSFNPASYTRRFLGSPISWRSGSYSFGGRHYAGSPMKDQIRGSLEQTVGTLEPQVQDALKVFDLQDEMCRNFTCCGVHLTDLHALLEHFEQVHIVVVDPPNPNGLPHTRLQVPFEPVVHPAPPQEQPQTFNLPPPQQQQPTHYPTPVDPDDMELEVPAGSTSPASSQSSGAPSPPETLISTPLSAYATVPSATSSLADAYPGGFPYADKPQNYPMSPYSTNPNSPYTSQPPSPHAASKQPVSAFDTTTVIRRSNNANPYPSANANNQGTQQHRPNLNLNLTQFPVSRQTNPGTPQSAGEPFNAYGRYVSDYSVDMPGAGVVGLEGAFDNMGMGQNNNGTINMGMMHMNMGMAGMELEMDGVNGPGSPATPKEKCVTPALLFSNAGTPESTPGHSRVGSPVPSAATSTTSPPRSGKNQEASSSTAGSSVAGSTSKSGKNRGTGNVGRPSTTSSLLMSKPFKCPKPNCNKSYKQANGLKYHITHGSCNFAPPKDLEHVQALLERKRKEKEKAAAAAAGDESEPGTPLRLSPTSTSHPATAPGSAASSAPPSALHSPSLDGNISLPSPSHATFPYSSQPNSPHPLSQSVSGQSTPGGSLLLPDLSLLGESDLREIERETEKRIRPFACTVGDCPRRYKNMNGLRYHYQHSGEHGAVGLAMLASGVHECLQQNGGNSMHHHGPGHHRERRRAKAESRGGSRAGTPPVPQVPTSTAILQQGQAQQQQQAQAQTQQNMLSQAQHVHLAYQQQYAEHQRAQYAAQQAAAHLTS
ncbi:hypothetical protein Moror_15938 [Moniliophthora roreri MCA 2997]|uniref:C2H2-type domain-containing protein n=2 Tax=Moniliophthora roreri TaxID=221103 RepID=V2XJU8_MONRO|nr:hypothetical protein Moror_15938 [Moniliophthora roreri MCA 2997]KAI3607340.1 hypothetical protein WG66_004795 [Moniliophthora roreri]